MKGEKPLLTPVESAKHHTLERLDTHNTLDRLDTARKTDLIKAQDGYLNFKPKEDVDKA